LRRIIAAILALIALMGLAATFSSAALADGDPASDVLVYYSVFAPPDLHANPTQLAQLDELVKYVSAHGYPIKVALVASSADLGTATQLWENPQDYSRYLGKELSYVTHDRLLVVMPAGYGLRDPRTHIPEGDIRGTSGLNAPGSELIAGAAFVIERLARDNGIRLPASLNAQAAAAVASSRSIVPWIGLVVGLIAVAGSWGVSLRLRPIRSKVLA
jgi:hypothetical protein